MYYNIYPKNHQFQAKYNYFNFNIHLLMQYIFKVKEIFNIYFLIHSGQLIILTKLIFSIYIPIFFKQFIAIIADPPVANILSTKNIFLFFIFNGIF